MVKYAFIISCSFILGALVVEFKQHFYQEIPEPIATLPDGGLYEGELRKGVLGGVGRISWGDGTYYEGEFREGFFHGEGLWHTHEFVYQGDFERGNAKGEGTMTFVDGSKYIGEVDFARPNGLGVLESANGDVYNGQFKEGFYSGQGELVNQQGHVYRGSFEKGLFHGYGVYTQSIHNEKNEETGVAEKVIFSGVFVKGQLTGEGIWLDGEKRYEGQFRDWLFHGKGLYSDSNGTYNGEFVDGVYEGRGIYEGADGLLYEGEFVSGRYYGAGTLTTAYGDSYKGEFAYGVEHGKGTLTYAQELDGIKSFKGEWYRGRLIEANKPRLAVKPSVLAEHAIYQQTNMLSELWSTLVDNDPEKIDLYFVGVAGDGNQGVFRREVEYIQQYFDQELDTQGKSLSLINSPFSYTEKPLATVTSIRQTLEKVAEKMDAEQDILFLYLTSHGSDDFKLHLNQPGVELAPLTAAELGDMLKSLPIKYKVVTVSSCFSGGFIPKIKDDYTFIMTAASKDKTSFGCRDLSTMTYFGEALFKDALPRSNSFEDAFYRARDIVRGREAKEGFEHSEPLLFKPKSVVKQLKKWRDQRQAAKQKDTLVEHATLESTAGTASLQ